MLGDIECLLRLNQTNAFCDHKGPLILQVFDDLLTTKNTSNGMQRYTFNAHILSSVIAIFRYAEEQSSLIVLLAFLEELRISHNRFGRCYNYI